MRIHLRIIYTHNMDSGNNINFCMQLHKGKSVLINRYIYRYADECHLRTAS